MNESFNRQFIFIDFKQLDDPAFLEFVGTAEFKTFLILLRYVWRGGNHRLGLDEMYHEEKKLVAAVGREFLAEKLCLQDATRVSKHLKKLEDLRVIQRMRTGRETIFILGEWVDISEDGDGSTKKEWFYYERVFGKRKKDSSKETQQGSEEEPSTSDVAINATSEVQNAQHQKWPESPHQRWREKPHSNIYNKIKNTVNVKNGTMKREVDEAEITDKTDLRKLADIEQPKEKTKDVANNILSQLGDTHSQGFYYLVAAKVPESNILRTLSEIKQDGANHPARVFSHRMKRYAEETLAPVRGAALADERKALSDRFKNY